VLREILHCLIENAFQAVAFSGPPEPRVWVQARAEADTIVVEVLDNGRGVHLADRDRVFQPYATTKKGGDQPLGTGLGLTIARRYAESIGGQVGLDVTREETCFYARFVAWRDAS
jgi:C4-dicarboxylate-specific signal transduction histidine kinase